MNDQLRTLDYELKLPPFEPPNRFEPTPLSRGLLISLGVAVFVAACLIALFLAMD